MFQLLESLKDVVGEDDFLSESRALIVYSTDASPFFGNALAVLRVENAKEVSKILRIAYENEIAVVVRGAGTGISGGAIPRNAIIIDTKKMNHFKIYEDDMIVVAEAGVIIGDLISELKKRGLFLPPEPGSASIATIGGFVANGGSGKRALKYGTIKNYLIGVEAVLPDGKIVEIDYRTHKTPGFLHSIFAGSEGTLGVITKVILRVIPLPEERRTFILEVNGFEEAYKICKNVIKYLPESVEYMDRSLAEKMGFSSDIIAIEDFHKNERLFNNLKDRAIILYGEEEDRFWKKRGFIGVIANKDKKRYYIADDYIVPFSKAVIFEKKLRKIAKEKEIDLKIFSHLDTANFHPAVISDDIEKAIDFAESVNELALKFNGTIGEHGIGLRNIFIKEIGFYRRVKFCLDQKNIMNPGKI